ncbi:MAG TPA: NAD(P)-dependent oxidoreductase [Jatrophihabitans sp.]|nr:NAD(P)-dependent oxidoreductase [Jatrophihabitans sp.]
MMRVFLAGGSGTIGRRLVPRLVAAGHEVVATTRTAGKAAMLEQLGARPEVVDALDASAVGAAVARAQPEAIVHQLTGLAGMSDLKHFDRTFAATNRLRTEGTDHLLAAARATGVRRFVAQSYTGWTNAREGGPVKNEDDPLDPDPPAQQRASLAAIRHVEQAVTAAPLESVVLRYGTFYGAGASTELFELVRRRRLPIVGDGGAIWSWIHVDDAAAATVAALELGDGIYNVVDYDPAPVREILTFVAELIGAKPPRRVPVWLARMAAGEVGVSMLTQLRGSSNAKARRELAWEPRWASWRDGLRDEFDDAAAQLRVGGGGAG